MSYSPLIRTNVKADSKGFFGVYSRHSLEYSPVSDVPEPIRTTLELARWTGVHVRSTESLKVYCNFHLELSGSRAKPTAVRRGA